MRTPTDESGRTTPGAAPFGGLVRGRECNKAERVVYLPCCYGPNEAAVRSNIHFALLDDVVLEVRANVADVEEVWLQLPTRGESALSPLLVLS